MKINKDFKTKEELFKYIRENKSVLIDAKKSEIYKSIDKGIAVTSNQKTIAKIAETTKSFDIDNDYYYFVVNSSNILDSHGDMHIEGNWEKSAKEQQGKTYLVFDHQLKRSEIIAMKKDVDMFTANIPFTAIGKNYPGNTYVLIYKVHKSKVVNSEAKQWLEDGHDFEASVRMQYMDVEFAVNSNDKEDLKGKELFDKYYPLIANKDEFSEDINFICIVKQAKNVLESSLVMFGSNGATGLMQENKEEPLTHSDENKDEPTEVTQKKNINLNLF